MPPLIGLLNMTDRAESLRRFQAERGDDPNTPISTKQIVSRHAPSASVDPGLVCGIVLAGAILLGGTIVWLVMITRRGTARGGNATEPAWKA